MKHRQDGSDRNQGASRDRRRSLATGHEDQQHQYLGLPLQLLDPLHVSFPRGLTEFTCQQQQLLPLTHVAARFAVVAKIRCVKRQL